jgi:hypothetical protein
MSKDDRAVVGCCPMGCGQTLFLASGGYITCSYIHCPRPDAVADLLGEKEHEHVVEFSDDGFDVRHPLRERLDDGLFSCPLNEHVAALPGPPVRPGRYRARAKPDSGWSWQALDA